MPNKTVAQSVNFSSINPNIYRDREDVYEADGGQLELCFDLNVCWSQLEISAEKLKEFRPSETNLNRIYYWKWNVLDKFWKIWMKTHIFGGKYLNFNKTPNILSKNSMLWSHWDSLKWSNIKAYPTCKMECRNCTI